MFDDFAGRVHILVSRPKTLNYNDDPDLEARLLSLRRDQLDWIAYDYLFDGGFETGLYFLPYALQDLAVMVEGHGELSDTVVIWVSAYRDCLEKLGLLRDTVGCLASVFLCWLDVLRVRPEADLTRVAETLHFEAVLEDGHARDSYLSHLIKYRLPGPSSEALGHHILCQWAEAEGPPTHSVHFLDMCARSATGTEAHPMVAAIYKTELVTSVASNLSLLRRHQAQAAKAWRQYGLPEWYTRDVARILGI